MLSRKLDCSRSENRIPSIAGSIATRHKVPRDCLSFLGGRLFPPEHFEEVVQIVHQSPQSRGLSNNRWTLSGLRQACDLLHDYTLSGVFYVLQRLGLHHKQGQTHYSSPDPDYQLKVDRIKACLEQVQQSQGAKVLLYADETTYFRQPSNAKVWYEKGMKNKPRAEWSYRRNNKSRIIGSLDSISGKVIAWQGFKAGIAAWVNFLKTIRQSYSPEQEIYLVLDNWPIHYKPQVVEAAEVNRIKLLYLPSYAPWLNPIEKLWRWMKQSVIHMHSLSNQWEDLKQQVLDFFHRFASGSRELLHYVGLLPY
ncbi:MAG TPA: IS630 family transposase [Thermodesulfobacteriota bacterium]|nr:IS630 family transposase [Thermodesulfobacteriota bacterium]